MKLDVQGKMSDGTEMNLPDYKFEFQSSDPRVATVSEDGTVEFVGEGDVVITCVAEADGYRKLARKSFVCGDGTMSVISSQDGYIVQWRSDEKYSTTTTLEARNASSNVGNTRKSYIKFDLDELDAEEIESVELSLNAAVKPESAADVVEIVLYSIFDDSWDEETLTSRTKPYLGRTDCID